MIARTRNYYLRHEVTEPLCPSLHIWAETPVAACLFPQLADITFRNEQEFGQLASRYLNEDSHGGALRQRIAADMRAVVERQFSYGARWESFVTGIREGLRRAAEARELTACR
jgi:hypothetical protein